MSVLSHCISSCASIYYRSAVPNSLLSAKCLTILSKIVAARQYLKYISRILLCVFLIGTGLPAIVYICRRKTAGSLSRSPGRNPAGEISQKCSTSRSSLFPHKKTGSPRSLYFSSSSACRCSTATAFPHRRRRSGRRLHRYSCCRRSCS